MVECNGWLPHCTFLLRPLAKEEKIANGEVSLEEDQYKNIDGNHRKRLLKSVYHYNTLLLSLLFDIIRNLSKYERVKEVLLKEDPQLFDPAKGVPTLVTLPYIEQENGERIFMTDMEEDVLAEGRNWEHTSSSIHTSKLQQLMTLYSFWAKAKASAIASKKKVKLFFNKIL